MKVVVLKFGGTSIETKEKRKKILKHVKYELRKGRKVIIVVSAIGRTSPYSTDTLKKLITNSVSKKNQDRLLACGEIISSIVIGDFLAQNDINLKIIKASEIGIKTDSNFTDANIIEVDNTFINNQLKSYDCLVVPGFQGIDLLNNITTLGRGGSDTTAVSIGSSIDAIYVKIISDVDGIYSADPKLIKKPIKYKRVNYENLVKITMHGSKVFHDKAAVISKLNNLNLRFYKLGNLKCGTKVVSSNEEFYAIASIKGVTYNNKQNYTRITIIKNGDVKTYYVEDSKYLKELRKNHNELFV